MKVFVDSDVIISSLVSSTGAAYLLLNQTNAIHRYASDVSVRELRRVVARLELDEGRLNSLIDAKFTLVDLLQPIEALKKKFAEHVFDPDDAHIAAGACAAKAKFLLTYNIRHFHADRLKQDFNILVLTPGAFLQYVRSQS